MLHIVTAYTWVFSDKFSFQEDIDQIHKSLHKRSLLYQDKINTSNIKVRIMRGKELVCNLHPGCLFGEMAILYNCKRTASVIASENIAAWSIDRSVFKMVVKVTGEQKNREKFDLLKSIKALSGIDFEKNFSFESFLNFTKLVNSLYL